jgi:DNA-directed RNA polymerase subunit RPC12/RpoP
MLRSWKAGLVLAVLGTVVVLWVLGRGDVIVAVVIGGLVLLSGRAMFRSYSTTKGPTGPAVDVDERGKLLVYACETCGEQLVLLRRGTDTPPRHCSEKMVLRQVDVPDRELN